MLSIEKIYKQKLIALIIYFKYISNDFTDHLDQHHYIRAGSNIKSNLAFINVDNMIISFVRSFMEFRIDG